MFEKKKGCIFVYGTLKVGGYFAEQFDDRRLSSAPATAKGTMYETTGNFPAAIFGGENTIIGELHFFEDINWILGELDYIEGSSPHGNKHDLYNRHIVKVTLEDGQIFMANTYEFNRPVKELKVRESGIWPI